jgi:hypothetical protein
MVFSGSWRADSASSRDNRQDVWRTKAEILTIA